LAEKRQYRLYKPLKAADARKVSSKMLMGIIEIKSFITGVMKKPLRAARILYKK
jgi:hypothetical protein